MSKKNNSNYETYSEFKNKFFHKIFQNIIFVARKKFFFYFKNHTNYTDEKSVIDIGTTPSLDYEQNVFLEKTKNNKRVTCLSNQDCRILLEKYKNIKEIIIGDGKKTNFSNNYFDIVHSNATIEHVGSFKNQIAFVKEMLRITNHYVFIQTPNRFYPIDFHTIIPFIHWLPKNIHRKILKLFKMNFYAQEDNINLLSKKELIKICKILHINQYKIIEHKLFFFTSNFILIIKK